MLSSMRGNKKNQVFIYALLALLALGLIGFGTGGPDGARINEVGKVGDEPILVTTYASTLQTQVRNANQQFGRALSAQEIQALGIDRNALQTLVSTAALGNETNRLGISVGDDQVQDEILSSPSFTGLTGTFDKEIYQRALQNSNISVKEYEGQARSALARQLVETAIASGTQLDNTQALALLKYAREERTFEWAKLDASLLDEPAGTPSDADIQDQYEKTPDAYTAPTIREVTYLTLSPEMLADEVVLEEGLLEESFADQTDRFNRPARRSVDRIVFGSETEAAEALAGINERVTTFDAIATDRGLEIADIDLGEIEQGEFPSEIDTALFESEDLGVVGPINTDLGPALFRINAVMDAQVTTFEEAEAELREELVGDEARRLISQRVNDIDDLLAGGATLEEIADETAMELGKISVSADTEDGIAAYDEFRAAVAAADIDDFAEITDLSDGGIFTIRLDQIIEPTLRPLADVRDQVVEDWTVGETLRLLQEKLEHIKPQLMAGTAFDEFGIVVQEATDIARGGFVDGAPIPLVNAVFDAAQSDVVDIVDDGGLFVARLNTITQFDASEEENSELVEQVNTQISNQAAADLLAMFADAVQARDGLVLNRVAIDQLNLQIFGGGSVGSGN